MNTQTLSKVQQTAIEQLAHNVNDDMPPTFFMNSNQVISLLKAKAIAVTFRMSDGRKFATITDAGWEYLLDNC